MKVKELAEILDLSPATVSLVLNNRPGISEATRKKVKDAVIELGCEDMINIKEKKKKTLLFVVYRKNTTDDKFQRFSQLFSEIIEGVESQAKLKNFQLMLSYVNDLSLQEEIVRIQNINLDVATVAPNAVNTVTIIFCSFPAAENPAIYTAP